MDDEITLVRETNPHTDEDSNAVFDVEKVTVFCRTQSISQNEFHKSGQLGLEAKYKFTTFKGNYGGERKLIYHGKEYVIYRTYELLESDEIELYVGEKEGVYIE